MNQEIHNDLTKARVILNRVIDSEELGENSNALLLAAITNIRDAIRYVYVGNIESDPTAGDGEAAITFSRRYLESKVDYLLTHLAEVSAKTNELERRLDALEHDMPEHPYE